VHGGGHVENRSTEVLLAGGIYKKQVHCIHAMVVMGQYCTTPDAREIR
jgi:hypothetical protein